MKIPVSNKMHQKSRVRSITKHHNDRLDMYGDVGDVDVSAGLGLDIAGRRAYDVACASGDLRREVPQSSRLSKMEVNGRNDKYGPCWLLDHEEGHRGLWTLRDERLSPFIGEMAIRMKQWMRPQRSTFVLIGPDSRDVQARHGHDACVLIHLHAYA